MIKFREMKSTFWIAAFLFLSGGIILMCKNFETPNFSLGSLLPTEIQGWKAGGQDELYDPQTIFNYIDGTGEVYRSYNFKQLLARRYTREGKPPLVVDFFDMGSSSDAFGVFTHDLEGEDAGVGQGSTYKGGLLSFWKDRFFVSIYAEEETEETKEALFTLGKQIGAAILKKGEKPYLLNFLPSDGLSGNAVHYFHTHLVLNYHFFVSTENILFLDQQTEAALASYGEKGKRSHLLVVRYPEQEKAILAYQSFARTYLPDISGSGLAKTEDNKWIAARYNSSFVFIIFNAPSDSFAEEIINKVEKKISLYEEGWETR